MPFGSYPCTTAYAEELNDFLAQSESRFDDTFKVSKGVEYGAFVVPLYLDEQFGADTVLAVTKRSSTGFFALPPSRAIYLDSKRRTGAREGHREISMGVVHARRRGERRPRVRHHRCGPSVAQLAEFRV